MCVRVCACVRVCVGACVHGCVCVCWTAANWVEEQVFLQQSSPEQVRDASRTRRTQTYADSSVFFIHLGEVLQNSLTYISEMRGPRHTQWIQMCADTSVLLIRTVSPHQVVDNRTGEGKQTDRGKINNS